MASEVFKLKTLEIDHTVTRGTRVGANNNAATKTIITTPDLFNEDADPDLVYTGETGVNNDYLLRAALLSNHLKGYGTFTRNSTQVSGVTGPGGLPQGLTGGDIVRNDKDNVFYSITGIEGDTVYLEEQYSGNTSSNVATFRKINLDSAYFEYVKSTQTENKLYFNKNSNNWVVTGVQASGPVRTTDEPLQFLSPEDNLEIQFLASDVLNAPDIATVLDADETLVESSTFPVTDLALTAVPFPHESLKVYIGKSSDNWSPDNKESLRAVEFEDYVVNYSQNPDLLFPYPPFSERSVAYLKFLEELKNERQLTIGPDFEGFFNVSKITEIPEAEDLVTPVQDIVPDTEEIKIGSTPKNRNFTYTIDYPSGIVNLIKHINGEHLIENIIYPANILWDGVSVIKGVDEQNVKSKSNLVIPPIAGLEGITGVVYYEDTDKNNLIKNVDYILEYGSGSLRLEENLKEGESVLVSYFVEGEDEEKESLDIGNLENLRTSKFPLLEGSLVLVKVVEKEEDGKIKRSSSVLVEGADYEVSYLTGKIRLLDGDSEETLKSLDISYTPLAQTHCIVQNNPNDTNTYRMTILDDALENVNLQALIFKIKNPLISSPKADPFKDDDDPDKISYESSILEDSLINVKTFGVAGVGFKNFSDKQLFAIGITGLIELGIDSALNLTPGEVLNLGITGIINSGVDETEVYKTENYSYDNESKQLTLDTAVNDERPDLNDITVATYSFYSDVLPYAPIQIAFPVFPRGASYFVVEGFDRSDVFKDNMVIRIDNFDPEASYYFKIREVSYDGQDTTITLYSVFPEDIRNPSFYMFDDLIDWKEMPSGTSVDRSSTVGTEQLIFKGSELQILESLRQDSLLMINNSDLYSLLAAEVVEDTVVATIFPRLAAPIRGDVYVSTLPIYEVGTQRFEAKNPILLDPPQPAFKISYEPPEGYEGSAQIAIDNEKIILIENVNGIENPTPYLFYFKDYNNIYSLAKAIMATDSTFPKLIVFIPEYRPFTISPEGTSAEDYYLGSGSWNTDLIIPFEEGTLERLPYVVAITPDVFRWSLTELTKDQGNFLIEDVDRISSYSSGQLLAFKSRITEDTYYHQISGSEIVEDDNSRTHTQVNVDEKFFINISNPVVHKYNNPIWVNIGANILSVSGNALSLQGDLSREIRSSYFLRFDSRYIYKVERIEVLGGNTLVTVSPSLRNNVEENNTFGYLQATDTPIYIDEPSHQPNFIVSYTDPLGHTGKGSIAIYEDRIELVEEVDGKLNQTIELYYNTYSDIVELVDAINGVGSVIAGSFPYSANVDAYKDQLVVGKFDTYLPEVTYGSYKELPYRVLIATDTFSVSYTPPVLGSTASLKLFQDRMVFTEVIPDTPEDLEKSTTVAYSGKSVYQIISEIESIASAYAGARPFSIVLNNTEEFFGNGKSGSFEIIAVPEDEALSFPHTFKAVVFTESWSFLGPLNIRRLEEDTDYVIEGGNLLLTEAIRKRDRLSLNYMGLDNNESLEDEDITVSCRFFTALPQGSRVDTYMDYLNIDQFYIQKLTERKFLEIVTVPQVKNLLDLKGSGGGTGNKDGGDEGTPVYEGGRVNDYYRLRDEEIKRVIYLKLFRWYKERLRFFASEAELSLGFRFAHSRHVDKSTGAYSLSDSLVENNVNYTLTTDEEIAQIENGFSKFFPVGYQGLAPDYYDRFGQERRDYNEVYCYNLRFLKKDGTLDRIEGRVKSDKPYWNKQNDIKFTLLDNASDPIVDKYTIDIKNSSGKRIDWENDRTFDPSNSLFSFLRRIDTGDKIKIDGKKNFYEIGEFLPGLDNEEYEILKLKEGKYFRDKGIKTFTVDSDGNYIKKVENTGLIGILKGLFSNSSKGKIEGDFIKIPLGSYEKGLGATGFRLVVRRQIKEFFPVYDDEANYGAMVAGEEIEGHEKDTDRIRKPPTLFDILKILFPGFSYEPNKRLRVSIGSFNEENGEFSPEIKSVDIKDLNFFQERKVSDSIDAFRFGFNNDGDIDRDSDKTGLDKYFYIDFERSYEADDTEGYIDSIYFRAKDRTKWFRFEVEDAEDIAPDYGFRETQLYRNFYEPVNLYQKLLLEKQAWETEDRILRDIFDYQEKMFRAYNGRLGAAYGTSEGNPRGNLLSVANYIKQRIEAYSSIIYFLTSSNGPIRKQLQEVDASKAIGVSYNNAKRALTEYSTFIDKTFEDSDSFLNVTSGNIDTWTNSYVSWVLSLRAGTIFQKDARQTFQDNTNQVEIGFRTHPAIRLSYNAQNTQYRISDAFYSTPYVLEGGRGLAVSALLNDTLNQEEPIQVSEFFLYRDHPTLQSLIDAVNNISTPSSQVVFRADLIFEHYPYGEYPVGRIQSVEGSQEILSTGSDILVSNVDDHRTNDARVLFLTKDSKDTLKLESSEEEVYPTYVSRGNPAKEAIDGLRVPGSWVTLPNSELQVMDIQPINPQQTLGYSFEDVTSQEEVDEAPIKDYRISRNLRNKIETTGRITVAEFEGLKDFNRANRPDVQIIKTFVLLLKRIDGRTIKVALNTRQYNTINKLIEVLNGNFYVSGTEDDGTTLLYTPVDPDDLQEVSPETLFNASLLGDPEVQGLMRPWELNLRYTQELHTFEVWALSSQTEFQISQGAIDPEDIQDLTDENKKYYNISKFNDYRTGWKPSFFNLNSGEAITFRINEFDYYSPTFTYRFEPETFGEARTRIQLINPQNPVDILAFDIFCWDDETLGGDRYYQIFNNTLIFRSANVNCSIELKERETLKQLVDRINSDTTCNQFFYANLKFERENEGYFEYTYLPNVGPVSVPRASLDNLYLGIDSVLNIVTQEANTQYQVEPTNPLPTPLDPNTIYESSTLRLFSDVRVFSIDSSSSYLLTAPVYNVDTTADTFQVSTTYRYDLPYEQEFSFSNTNYDTIGELVTAIDTENNVPEKGDPIFNAVLVNNGLSTSLLPQSGSLTTSFTNISRQDGLITETGFSIQVSTPVSPGYQILNATYEVPAAQNILILRCTLRYTGTFTSSVYDLNSYTAEQLSDEVNDNQKPYASFPSLFSSSYVYQGPTLAATELEDTGGSISVTGATYTRTPAERSYALGGIDILTLAGNINADADITGFSATPISGYTNVLAKYLKPVPNVTGISNSVNLEADMRDIVAVQLLHMGSVGTCQVTSSQISCTSGGAGVTNGLNKNLHEWVDVIKGGLNTGFLGINILPLKVPSVPYGELDVRSSFGLEENEPTNVHFGFLGDIEYKQISDFNLNVQLNFVKKRLAKPWLQNDGSAEKDYYNSSDYWDSSVGNKSLLDDGNLYALHNEKFLNYVKIQRFRQLKTSIADEAIVQNKYLWLYLKFHREFGCDQQIKILKKKIREDEEDAQTVGFSGIS